MTRYLLDTNIISALSADATGPIARRLNALPDADPVTSIIVAAEARFGVAKRGSAKLARTIEGLLAWIKVMGFDPPADQIYARLRHEQERRGRPLGDMDTLIAAHAIALDAVLVSDDRAFEHVPGLRLENWLA